MSKFPPSTIGLQSSRREKMTTLPRFMVVRANSNNKYLRYIHEGKNEVPSGFLKFSGEEAMSHYGKFEVEMAKSSENKGLVHIRCCHNNKYWVSLPGTDKFDNEVLIVAAADEPEEDRSKTTCTLFDPIYEHVDGFDDYGDDVSAFNFHIRTMLVRFRHVQLGYYASLCHSSNSSGGLYRLSATPQEELTKLWIVDWESLAMKLPKYVAFKGHNGKYLSTRLIDGNPYLQFESTDIRDPTVGNTVFTNSDGSLRIMSNSLLKFWRLTTDDWIRPDSDDCKDWHLFFWPVKVGENSIALRSMRNKNFCKSFTINDNTRTSGLKADVPTIHTQACLEVIEPVLFRKIYNVNFRLGDSRIYNRKVVEMATGEAVNHTVIVNTRQLLDPPRTITVKLSYTKTKSSSWNSSFSSMLKLGNKSSIDTGVPVITDKGKIEIESTGTVQQGKMESVCNVAVTPRTRVKVRLLATEASCDVPFSYTQRDTLTTGEIITTDNDDGVYTGSNTFDFKFNTTEEKL